jgi:putative flavoprotein involved in K+ transport
VAVPSVRRARDELGLRAVAMVERLTASGARWPDGHEEPFDAVVWCTGFRPALHHLRGLALPRTHGHPRTDPGHPVVAAGDPRVLFVGYGDWCGPASATLIGCGRPARDAVEQAARLLDRQAAGRGEPDAGSG